MKEWLIAALKYAGEKFNEWRGFLISREIKTLTASTMYGAGIVNAILPSSSFYDRVAGIMAVMAGLTLLKKQIGGGK